MAIFAARWSDGNTYQLHFLGAYGRHSLKIKNYPPVIKAQIIKYRLVKPLQKAKNELTWAHSEPLHSEVSQGPLRCLHVGYLHKLPCMAFLVILG